MDKYVDPFYRSTRWKQKRNHILRRDKYLCQQSKRYGKLKPADTVHHIFPREEYPEYQWCDWNLISLSHDEHNRLHDRDSHQLTRAGIELMERTARRLPPGTLLEKNAPETGGRNFFQLYE